MNVVLVSITKTLQLTISNIYGFWRNGMNSWFANISVNMKLALGFGVVLVLTALLAVVGWNSLGNMTYRSDRVADINKLGQKLTDLRVSRLQYMLSNGDETAAQTVQTALDGFKAQQQFLQSTFTHPLNVPPIKAMGEQISAYQSSLNKMREAYQASAKVRADMGVDAVKAADLIAAINDDVMKLEPTDERRFEQYEPKKT
jgi:methyl-accepting chemotaxis protein